MRLAGRLRQRGGELGEGGGEAWGRGRRGAAVIGAGAGPRHEGEGGVGGGHSGDDDVIGEHDHAPCLRRWNWRVVMCRAAAPSRLVMRPTAAAATSNSLRLIVKVSIWGRHFHGAATPRHFYVAVAQRPTSVNENVRGHCYVKMSCPVRCSRRRMSRSLAMTQGWVGKAWRPVWVLAVGRAGGGGGGGGDSRGRRARRS